MTIGASVMSLQHPFMADLITGYNEFIRQTNIKMLITGGGNMEPEKQVNNVENYIVQRVDGILVQCIDINTIRDTINRAMDQGIPVGYYPPSPNVKAVTYFNYNEYDWEHQLGVVAADWNKTHLNGKAKVISFQSSVEPQSLERAKGCTDTLVELCGNSNLTIVTVEAKNAETAAANTEAANPDARVIMAFAGHFARPVTEVVAASGLPIRDFFIGTCDGTTDDLDLLGTLNSPFHCDSANSRYVNEIGYYWAQNMIKCIAKLPYDNPFPIPTVAVTQENVKAYRSRAPEYILDSSLKAYMDSRK
ncbi:MAG: sugar ABC transporter substrate-binding protein [Treponema sp.]|jgi:ribose transport system substrate-binding protein|nr:sugar ABC transporter substrate-binding protein [Treponema sp.]